MTENIKHTLLEYFMRKSVDYAVMLNGAWGTGKTYFAQNSLEEVFKAGKLAPVYVSLNGVSSFEEVAAQIVFGTGWSASKSVAKSFLLPLALKYLPEKSVSAILSLMQRISEKKARGCLDWLRTDKDLSPKTHVIILDDLERVADAEQNLVPIMGRVFDEFISRGYHVVFIGDETHIDVAKYVDEKEKYIRHTIAFESDVDDVIDSIVASFVGVAGRHAKLCCENLKIFALTCDVHNIRTLKRIADDFVSLAAKINDEATLKKVARTLLFCLAPIVVELSEGRLKPSDKKALSELKNVQVQRYNKLYKRFLAPLLSRNESGTDDSQSKSFAQDFVDRYDGRLPIDWFYNECIIDYEIEGDVDSDFLKKTVVGWIPRMPDKYQVALSTIWGWESIDDSTFKANCPIVLEGLKTGKYNAENVNLACALFNHFNENGWVSIDFTNMMNGAVRALKKRWTKLPDDYINPMILHNRQEDFLKPIVDAIQEEQSRREKNSADEEALTFLKALCDGDKETAWSLCPEGRSCLIFDKIVAANKCKEFCDISNGALSLAWHILNDRWQFLKPHSRGAIERIVQGLEAAVGKCDSEGMPLRKHQLEGLKAKFSDVLSSPSFAGDAARWDVPQKIQEDIQA